MFHCNRSIDEVEFFKSCKRNTNRMRKIGKYFYNPNNLIGEGTFSRVYEGSSLQNGKSVAIKVIDLKIIKQSNILYQQTQFLSQLDHHNIIKSYAVMQNENFLFVIMELCKRENLADIIKKNENNKLFTDEKQRIIYEIFQGLLYLAQKTIIHRDIKTANILFSESGRAKIGDFGLATYGLNEFEENAFVGTPLYMSPQALFYQKYSPKTDIWSFGVIVYELYLGQTPLNKCKTEKEFKTKITQPIQIPENSLLEGCLEPNSMKRWNIDKLSSCSYIEKFRLKFNTKANLCQTTFSKRTLKSTLTRLNTTTCDESISLMNDLYFPHTAKNSIIEKRKKISIQNPEGLNLFSNLKRLMTSPVQTQHKSLGKLENSYGGSLAKRYKTELQASKNVETKQRNYNSISSHIEELNSTNPDSFLCPIKIGSIKGLRKSKIYHKHTLHQTKINFIPSQIPISLPDHKHIMKNSQKQLNQHQVSLIIQK